MHINKFRTGIKLNCRGFSKDVFNSNIRNKINVKNVKVAIFIKQKKNSMNMEIEITVFLYKNTKGNTQLPED